MSAGFVRRCNCGAMVKISHINKTVPCGSCGEEVSLQEKRLEPGSKFDQDQPVTISPVVD